MLTQHGRGARLDAAQPHVLPDGVPSPTAGELGVVRDQGGASVRRVDGERIIGGLVELRLGCCPALVTSIEKDPANGDGDIVVQDEPHGDGSADLDAARTDDGDVIGSQQRVGRHDLRVRGPVPYERLHR